MATVSEAFQSSLVDSPHTFLQPSLPLYTDILAYLQHSLNPVAAHVSNLQQQRQQEARKKRKRGQQVAEEDALRLRQIHTDGLEIEQIWEQARRVIDAARAEAERGLQVARTREPELDEEAADGFEDDDDESLGVEGVDYEVEGMEDDDEDDAENDGLEDGDDLDEDMVGAEDMSDFEDEADMDGDKLGDEPSEEFVSDKFGLNDGFFSIDNFNKQSEFLEQQDARGDDDGAASDEEDVDWETDPLALSNALGAGNANLDGEEEVDDDEDGPTFGDPDAPSEDEDEDVEAGEMNGLGDMANTNDVMYAEFFAPPAQKKKKNKKGRPNPHNFPAKGDESAGEVEEIDRTMAAVHRDLFEDDESEQEDESNNENVDPSDPKSRRSTYERRKAALAEEIRKLEAANVAKREWTLSGEARAADRPINSLLEEDLDFERAGKPVPVITAEVSESIEELIKRRILAQEFQDIIRRRPDDLATGQAGRRGRLDFELDNNKSKKGLAEEYEEEHLRRSDPNFVDAKDEKQKKEEQELEALMKKVFSDLDSLSNWHYRPKQPVPQLDIRVDAPAIQMEDARPSAGGEVATTSQLAPQEVYKAGEAAKGLHEEVVGKSGLPASREEMSREEKKRRRRREKERIHKAKTNEGADGTQSKRTQEKKEVLGDLKRGGVKVIGKKGEMRDVEGREVRGAAGGNEQGAARFKL